MVYKDVLYLMMGVIKHGLIGESRDYFIRHSIHFLLQNVGLQHLKGTPKSIVLIYKNQATFYRQLL